MVRGRNGGRGVYRRKARLPWPLWLVLGGFGAYFFWFKAIHLQVPGAWQAGPLNAFENLLHDPEVLLRAGWVSIGAGGVLAGIGWLRGWRRRALLDRQRSLDDIRAMTWQEFELLVGEFYRRIGYAVTECGLGGADGGIDLVLRRKKEVVLVQCKQWRTISVGAPVVREMYGLMAHHEATQVFIVCCGHFTRDAQEFCRGKPITLVTGEELLGMVQSVRKAA